MLFKPGLKHLCCTSISCESTELAWGLKVDPPQALFTSVVAHWCKIDFLIIPLQFLLSNLAMPDRGNSAPYRCVLTHIKQSLQYQQSDSSVVCLSDVLQDAGLISATIRVRLASFTTAFVGSGVYQRPIDFNPRAALVFFYTTSARSKGVQSYSKATCEKACSYTP